MHTLCTYTIYTSALNSDKMNGSWLLRLKWLWRTGISCRKILLLLMWEVLFELSWGLFIGNKEVKYHDFVFMSITKCLSLLLAPLVGLLADVKYGRYEVIKAGSLVSFLACLFYYFALLSSDDASVLKTILFCAATIFVCIGDTCYSAAMLPFITDQLIGATSDELSAIVRWYYWAKYLSFGLCDIILHLVIYRYMRDIKFEAVLFLAIPLAVIIISDCLCQQWLDRTHNVTNPIKLIIQVLNYT